MTGSAAAFRSAADRARAAGSEVGFVPTMGALHDGHASLMRSARGSTGFVAASVFVNPLQFASGSDLASYPRDLDRDRATAESLGVDILFAPDEHEIYPNGRPDITVEPGPLGERLEGRSRPGHFRGVLTVVAKVLHLVGPCRAFFGQKDAQQLELVRRMVADLDFPVQVEACPTVRAADGVALSSRNLRLTSGERRAAPVLFEALSDAAEMVKAGEHDGDVIRAAMARTIGSEPAARLDYVAVVDEVTWADVRIVHGPSRALVAASFGETRLIDNLTLPVPPAMHNSGEPGAG